MIAKAKLAGMWREKVEQTNSGPVIVEVNRPPSNSQVLPRKGRDRWVALRQQAMADGLLDAAIPTRVEHVPPDASFDFAMIRRQKISARHLFGAGKNATLKKVSAICGAMPLGSSHDD